MHILYGNDSPHWTALQYLFNEATSTLNRKPDKVIMKYRRPLQLESPHALDKNDFQVMIFSGLVACHFYGKGTLLEPLTDNFPFAVNLLAVNWVPQVSYAVRLSRIGRKK